MKFFHGSIRKKIIILVLLATAPVFLVLSATVLMNRQHAVIEAKNEAAKFLNGFAEVQRRVTTSTRTLMRTVASMPGIRTANIERSRVILETLLETNPIYTNVILVDIKGNVVAAGRNHDKAKKLNFSDRKQFKEAIVSKEFASGEFVVGKSSQKSIFPFGMAVLNKQGTPNGVILIGVDLNHYGQLFKRGDYPQNTFLGLCDHNGLRLFRYPISDKIIIGKPIKEKVFKIASTAGGSSSVMAQSTDGLKRIIVFEPISLTDGEPPYMYMFMGRDYQQIIGQANTILYSMVFSTILSMMVALAIAWFIGGKGIAHNVEKLTRMTHAFGKGEESVISDIDYNDGEVGKLAQSFDNMVFLLRQRKEERRKAEKALQISHERFLSVLDGIDATVYVADMETYEILFMNKFMIKAFGRDMTGEKCWASFRNELGPCEYCTNDQIVNEKLSEAVVWQDQNPITNKFYVNHDRAIEWTDGRLVRLQIATDITDLKQMEAQFSQTQKMEAIGTLSGGIAHDFNNILFPILGHTEMLIEDIPKDSQFQKSLNQIYSGALRARDLVQQILAFSRQGTSELKLVQMQPIIKEALKLIRSTIPTTISIKQRIQSDCGAVSADPTQIHQIVMNLTTNAYHAMEENGGELKVNLKEIKLGKYELINPDMTPGSYACLSIADTGMGMEKDLTEKIFDPFFTTKKKGKGTGMGLSVVHGIIMSMNGSIQVYSEPGKGTEFNVYIPVGKSSSEEQTSQVKQSIQGGTEQILLVDDEEAILTMEKQVLERLGYKVTSCTSSIEALESFRANSDNFDLVITDMAMPNMTGDELSKELLSIRPDIPVIICTGFSEKINQEQAEVLGVMGFLMKPVVKYDMAQMVRKVIDKGKPS